LKLNSKDLLLYLVTDRRWLKNETLPDVVEKAVKNGVSFVQLREKNLSFDKFKKLALEIKQITDLYNIPFVINDNIDIAIEVDADGVHIGQDDLDVEKARKHIGKETLDAENKGADYLGVTIFPTMSKADAANVNLEKLKEIKSNVNIPVIAIGGIREDNLPLLEPCRIDGIAVISAILAKDDIEEAAKNLHRIAKKYLGNK
jgi:thiamine-phosphate pyrophosphorylase